MVTTDFETHHLWITEPCEHYFTATEEGSLYLQRQGIAAAKTSVVGIPIHPVFCEPKSRAACLARHGLAGDRPILLQLAGGRGVGRIEEIHRAILETFEPVELVTVTAYNVEARRRLNQILVPARHRVHVLGYTDKMDELLAVADLVVSKPGGLSASEVLARGVPLLIVDPVPGQECRNSDYLLECGAAAKVNHLPTMGAKIAELLGDPGRLRVMRSQAQRLAKPRAAFAVIEQSLDIVRRQRPPTPGHAQLRGTAESTNGLSAASFAPGAANGASLSRFQELEPRAMRLFAGLWHHCSSNESGSLPSPGPALVVANHPNFSDPAFLMCASGRTMQFLHAAVSYETFGLRPWFRAPAPFRSRLTGPTSRRCARRLMPWRQGKLSVFFPKHMSAPRGNQQRVTRRASPFWPSGVESPFIPLLFGAVRAPGACCAIGFGLRTGSMSCSGLPSISRLITVSRFAILC